MLGDSDGENRISRRGGEEDKTNARDSNEENDEVKSPNAAECRLKSQFEPEEESTNHEHGN